MPCPPCRGSVECPVSLGGAPSGARGCRGLFCVCARCLWVCVPGSTCMCGTQGEGVSQWVLSPAERGLLHACVGCVHTPMGVCVRLLLSPGVTTGATQPPSLPPVGHPCGLAGGGSGYHCQSLPWHLWCPWSLWVLRLNYSLHTHSPPSTCPYFLAMTSPSPIHP